MTQASATHDDDVIVVSHPLVQHKLTLMRERQTSTGEFRNLARELSLLIGYEAMRDLPLEPVEIDTPWNACRHGGLRARSCA